MYIDHVWSARLIICSKTSSSGRRSRHPIDHKRSWLTSPDLGTCHRSSLDLSIGFIVKVTSRKDDLFLLIGWCRQIAHYERTAGCDSLEADMLDRNMFQPHVLGVEAHNRKSDPEGQTIGLLVGCRLRRGACFARDHARASVY
jgi:hypothetical protein